MLFSAEAAPLYILADGARGSLPHSLTSTHRFFSSGPQASCRCEVRSPCGLTSDAEHLFMGLSAAVCLLRENVSSDPPPISQIAWGCFYLLLRLSCVMCLDSDPFHIYSRQGFSRIRYVAVSFCRWCPWPGRRFWSEVVRLVGFCFRRLCFQIRKTILPEMMPRS